jgi:hypothetical protein
VDDNTELVRVTIKRSDAIDIAHCLGSGINKTLIGIECDSDGNLEFSFKDERVYPYQDTKPDPDEKDYIDVTPEPPADNGIIYVYPPQSDKHPLSMVSSQKNFMGYVWEHHGDEFIDSCHVMFRRANGYLYTSDGKGVLERPKAVRFRKV